MSHHSSFPKTSLITTLLAWVALIGLAATCGWAADQAPFASEIQAFEQADQKQMPPRDAVLFVGSSSIRLWKTLPQDFPDLAVINRGFGGSTIRDSTRYADRIVIPYHPKRIILYAGDNDIAQGRTPQELAGDFKQFVQKVRASLPGVPIDFISIKPSLARWKLVDKIKEANRLVESLAGEEQRVGYFDVFTPMLGPDGKPRGELLVADGLHMNRAGYELWTSIIAPRLK